jgi:UPF0271 protein
MQIDLNCDMGEMTGDSPLAANDAAIMPFVSSANIACGGHAGDADTMRRTVRLALQHNVAIGAHPSFPDREGFGRRQINMPADELRRSLLDQMAALDGIAKAQGGKLHHVKPHGALYNLAARDAPLARSIALAVRDFDPTLILYGQSGSCSVIEARQLGLQTAQEAFADRTYRGDGSLTPRSEPGALIRDVDQSIAQALQIIRNGKVATTDGETIPITADTLCIHGDEPQAPAFARQIYAALRAAGITVKGV